MQPKGLKMIRKYLAALCIASALLLDGAGESRASQGSCVMPTTGTVSGLTLVQDINTCLQAMLTMASGASAPTNGAGGVTQTYQMWLKTTDGSVNIYDGTSSVPLGYLDTSGHIWRGLIGGGTATVASATTTDPCSSTASTLTISGTTTITSLSNACIAGTMKLLKFSGALILTHNATSLILPNNGNNITTVAGDSAIATYLGGGNWQIWGYVKTDGTALNTSSAFTGAIFFNAQITPSALVADTNDWTPTGLSTANVIRASASTAINLSGITAPATDGKILVIDNVGTSTITATSQDTNSTAANRFAFDRPIALRGGRSLTIKYDTTASRWRLIQEITAQPTAASFKNLVLVNGGTPNNQVQITADELTVEDTAGGIARLSTVLITPDITVSGVNGLDTGSVATSTGYFIWIVFNPTTNNIGGLFSLSSTAPTMPSGYTFKARVGWNRTDASSHLHRVRQLGRIAQYVVTAATPTTALPNLGNGVAGTYALTSAPTWAAASVSTFVPSTAARIEVVAINKYNNLNLSSMVVAPNNAYSGIATTNPPPLGQDISGANSLLALSGWLTLESTNIYWASNQTGAAIFAKSWEDNL